MDLLQRELARKKAFFSKASADATEDDGDTKKRKKYRKYSEWRRFEEEDEEERENLKRRKQEQYKEKNSSTSETPKTQTQDGPSGTNAGIGQQKTKTTDQSSNTVAESQGENSAMTLNKDASSPMQVTLQLRALGLPIRFFGETHTQRLGRLQCALTQQHQTLQGLSEMEEYRLGQGHGIRNPFLGRDSNSKTNPPTEAPTDAKSKSNEKDEHGNEQEEGNQEPEDAEEDDDDPPKRIYRYFKGLLKEWEADVEARPSSIAKSVTGRNELKTLKQCKDYIRPLFKQLKRRKLEAGMQAHLTKIMEFAQRGEFVKAHDAYIDVAIGRAAWPIGVTMVGIHARSGRAKIESSNVAHVMNSELQRKYLTSVKRLLTYAQKKRPDVDPSRKVA